jgi:hypothetical protein
MTVEERERLRLGQPVRELICSRAIDESADTRLYFLPNVVPMEPDVS